MTHFHIDVFAPDDDPMLTEIFRVKLVDFGPDGVFGGGDDSEQLLGFFANGAGVMSDPPWAPGSWVGLDIPMSAFWGLTSTSNIAQIVLEQVSAPTIYIDNMYFYK